MLTQLQRFLHSRRTLLSCLLAVIVLSLLLLKSRHLFTNTFSAEAKTVQTTASTDSQANPIAANFFGLTVLNYQNLRAKLPFGITRTWDAYPGLDWADANPAPGQFVFAPLDAYLSSTAKAVGRLSTLSEELRNGHRLSQTSRAPILRVNVERPTLMPGMPTLQLSCNMLRGEFIIGSYGTNQISPVSSAGIFLS